ncbi:MAG: tyrosine-type recombinase/integrase [Desulfatibacillum sp.]|nr:tyrosine-type recombinase/integrase [Desulfatibacillum sp.]
MASKVLKNGKVRWQACVKKDGARRQKVFATRKEALDWEAEQRKVVEETKTDTPSWTLLDWASEYLDDAQSRFAVKTYNEKRSVFKNLLKTFPPNSPVEAMEPGALLRFFRKQEKTRSGYAANKDRKNLGAAWNWGRKYLKGFPDGPNPILTVEKRPEKRKPRYVPPEEHFWKVYELTEGQDRVMLLTFLHLAARRGEVFGIKWSDLDFVNSRVRLWTRKRRGGNLESDWLPITKELKSMLLWWWEERPFKTSSHVFLCQEETAFTKDYYGKPFTSRLQFMRRLCDRAGIKRFGFHAIRHLSASILYQKGVETAVIQAILRHKNPSTTDRYLRSLGLEHTRDALEMLSGKAKVLEFQPRKKTVNDQAPGLMQQG